jgi:hypothetical protein
MRRWPWMTCKTHDKVLADWQEAFRQTVEDLTDKYQKQIDAEYQRAVKEGRAQLHKIAVDMTYDLFVHGMNAMTAPRMRALLQEVEHMFDPSRTKLEEE